MQLAAKPSLASQRVRSSAFSRRSLASSASADARGDAGTAAEPCAEEPALLPPAIHPAPLSAALARLPSVPPAGACEFELLGE